MTPDDVYIATERLEALLGGIDGVYLVDDSQVACAVNRCARFWRQAARRAISVRFPSHNRSVQNLWRNFVVPRDARACLTNSRGRT